MRDALALHGIPETSPLALKALAQRSASEGLLTQVWAIMRQRINGLHRDRTVSIAS